MSRPSATIWCSFHNRMTTIDHVCWTIYDEPEPDDRTPRAGH